MNDPRSAGPNIPAGPGIPNGPRIPNGPGIPTGPGIPNRRSDPPRPDRTRWWVALGGSALAGIAIGVWFYQSVAG